MDERVMQFRVGVTVLATLIITAILVLIFGQMSMFTGGSYMIRLRLREAPGVTQYTPVRKSGVLIGRISSRPELQPDGTVIVTANIEKRYPLRPEEHCQVSYSTLGDAKVEFITPANLETKSEPVKEGHTFEGDASQEPLKLVADMQSNLNAVMLSVARTSEDLSRVARRVDGLLNTNEGRISGVIAQADSTMKAIEKTMHIAGTYLDDDEMRQQIKQTLKQMPGVIQDTRGTLLRMQETFALIDRNLRDLQGITEPLKANGAQAFQRIDSILSNVDEITRALTKFSNDLNNDQGTLGQLIKNPELYQNVNRVSVNLDQLIRDLRPIIDDARVFTDKIARHPESLGVRGALERRPGIK